jgi:hypothetical protein
MKALKLMAVNALSVSWIEFQLSPTLLCCRKFAWGSEAGLEVVATCMRMLGRFRGLSRRLIISIDLHPTFDFLCFVFLHNLDRLLYLTRYLSKLHKYAL